MLLGKIRQDYIRLDKMQPNKVCLISLKGESKGGECCVQCIENNVEEFKGKTRKKEHNEKKRNTRDKKTFDKTREGRH